MDSEEITSLIGKQVIRGKSIFTELLQDTIADAYKRLIAPSVEREMRNILTERAETDAVKSLCQEYGEAFNGTASQGQESHQYRPRLQNWL